MNPIPTQELEVDSAAGEDVEYYCPACNAPVNPDATACPNCGLAFDTSTEDEALIDSGEAFTQLLPEEKVLYSARGLTVTTHRVRSTAAGSGNAEVTSIMLDELASCNVLRTSNPLLLMIAGFGLLIAVIAFLQNAQSNTVFIIAGLVVAVIFVLLFYLTRQQVLELASAGAAIRIADMGMSVTKVKSLFDLIESAKDERYMLGRSS